jgi:1,4-dihydroxy-2-naphthoyl-CoA synthase
MAYNDVLYETRGSAVWITINRPDKYNAFRGVTCEELIHAITRAGWDKSVAAIVLTGAGEKAFCTGGDQSAHDGGYDGRGTIGLPVEDLQSSIRDVPKPVIARVNGFAIGGGNVLAPAATLLLPARGRCSVRSDQVLDPLTQVSERRFWPASRAKRRLAKSGSFAAGTPQNKRCRWG